MDSKIHLIIFRNVVITLNLLKHCNLYCVHYANERLTLLDKISIKTFQHKITNNLFECLCLVVASFLSFTILNLKFYFCKRSFVGFYLFYLFILYGSQQIKNTVIYIYIYMYYLNTTCSPGYHHNGFMATGAFGRNCTWMCPNASVAIKPLRK